MAFWARSIIYNGIPSETFGLMLYDIENYSQSEGTLGTKISIVEDRIRRRNPPIHYGITNNDPLTFKLVMGVTDQEIRLDRYDLAAIAGWLTGHSEYKWLHICQPDLELVRYRCLITELRQIEIGMLPVAFEATVVCDGPYAYHLPWQHSIVSSGQAEYLCHNPSNVNEYYFPSMVIECPAGTTDISIANAADPGRSFALAGLSGTASRSIAVDGETLAVQATDGTDLYENCSLEFLRLVRGDNPLTVNGACTVTLKCEVPMNIGY